MPPASMNAPRPVRTPGGHRLGTVSRESRLTGHLPSYGEVANVAVFAASDWARTITASEINFTGGAVVD